MSASGLLSASTSFSLVVLSLALLLTVVRIVRGPTLPDRVLGLDMLVAIAIGLIAVIAIRSGFNLYIDIAIALGLVGFLATVAFARFIMARGISPETDHAPVPGNRPVQKPKPGKQTNSGKQINSGKQAKSGRLKKKGSR